MAYRALIYFERIFSDGLDDSTVYFELVDSAVRIAKNRVRRASNGACHAVIVNGSGGVVATVVKSKGRVYVKRARV